MAALSTLGEDYHGGGGGGGERGGEERGGEGRGGEGRREEGREGEGRGGEGREEVGKLMKRQLLEYMQAVTLKIEWPGEVKGRECSNTTHTLQWHSLSHKLGISYILCVGGMEARCND